MISAICGMLGVSRLHDMATLGHNSLIPIFAPCSLMSRFQLSPHPSHTIITIDHTHRSFSILVPLWTLGLLWVFCFFRQLGQRRV